MVDALVAYPVEDRIASLARSHPSRVDCATNFSRFGSPMIARNDRCPICGSPAFKDTDDVVPGYSCLRCGDYRIDGARWKHFELEPTNMVRLSGWVREQNAAEIVPAITPELFTSAIARSIPNLTNRALAALKWFATRYPRLDVWLTFEEYQPEFEMLGVSYSADQSELDVLLELLSFQGFVEKHQGAYRLSVLGLLKVEELGQSTNGSATGFVAMSFDPTMNNAWISGFEPGIRAAGFSALRISEKDFVGGITDEIVAEIRRSRFVVADYTGQKAGVYFEAGFALGLGLTIIPTCREDEIGKLHFDIKHLNTLVWKEPGELAAKLEKRIRAVMGRGPIAS